MFDRTAAWGAIATLLSLAMPANAQTCTPLQLVGGEGSEVTKTVTVPTIPGPFGIRITRNNWNTDWAVPGGQRFQRFAVTMVSEDGGKFDIRLYLKYSDQTADQFYEVNNEQLKPTVPLELTATSRPDDQPYQVNLFVGGVESIGDTYTASVEGCR